MINTRLRYLLLWVTLTLGLGVSGCVIPTPTVAHVRDVVDIEVFFQPLAPFGSWIVLEGYGHVWIPQHLRAGWRPYTDGRWVYTEDGWMWIAEEEWGWATFHYGRWDYAAQYGWFWVPDVVWAPAWVSWQYMPGWVGWAPLPPTAIFRAGIGFGSVYFDIAPSYFCFVEERWLLAPRVRHYIASPSRNVALLKSSRNVTRYTVVNNRVVNRGIAVERIEEATRRPVPRLRMVDTQDDRRTTYVREREREVVVARPPAVRNAAPPEGRPGRPPASPPGGIERDQGVPPSREQLRPGAPEPRPGIATPQMPSEPRRQPTERPPRRERVVPEQVTPQEPPRQNLRPPPGASRQDERDQPRQPRQSVRPPQEERQQSTPTYPPMGRPQPPTQPPTGRSEPSSRPPQGSSGRAQGQPPQQGVPTPPSSPEAGPPPPDDRRGPGMMSPPGGGPFPPAR